MTGLHVLVVDDEPLARTAIRIQLERHSSVARVTECSDGVAAVERIRAEAIDLVYLDVCMPEVDGFEVVRRVGSQGMPPVVFVTAFDEFAVAAFEVRALDYLLKPFTPERFDGSFARVFDGRQRADGPEAGFSGLIASTPASAAPEHLRIKIAGRTTMIPLDEILWIEAANSYVRVHASERTHLLRASLSSLEGQLDPARFQRVHRSAIVHINAILELRHRVRGDYELVLRNGVRLRASRRRRAALFDWLKTRTL